MKIYYNNGFKGRWPVGTSAIVVASNAIRAATILEIELTECGLEQEVFPNDMIEIRTRNEDVLILQDGEY